MVNFFKECILLGALFFIISLPACQENEEIIKEDELEVETISRSILSINEFKSLVIVNNQSESENEDTKSNLYGVDADDELKKIGFSLQQGTNDSTPAYKIIANTILNVNEDYILISGNFKSWNTKNEEIWLESILLNKNNGVFFDMSDHSVLQNGTLSGDRVFQEDGNGSLYFKSKTRQGITAIKKLEILDSESINITELYSKDFLSFEVDSKGNIFLYSYDKQADRAYKVMTLRGIVLGLEIEDRSNMVSWIGSDGNFYLTTLHLEAGRPQNWTIYRVTMDNLKINVESLWAKDFSSLEAELISTMNRTGNNHYTMRFDGQVLFFVKLKRYGNDLTRSVFTFDEQTSELSVLNNLSADISADAEVLYNTNFYYINDFNRLLKVSYLSTDIVEIVPKNKYLMHDFSVSENNEVFVCAKRNSDNKNVLIKVGNNSEVIIDEDEIISYDFVFSLKQYLY